MVQIIGCKVKVSKSKEVAVKSIERIKEQGIYTVVLNDGFEFDFGGQTAIAYDSKQVQDCLKAIVMPVVESIEVEVSNEQEQENKFVYRTKPVISESVNEFGQKFIVYAPTNPRKFRFKKAKKQKVKKVKTVKIDTFSEKITVVTQFLKGTKTAKQLAKKHTMQFVLETLKEFNLHHYNYANFKGLSDSKIVATLKFYKRTDLIDIFNKSLFVA